MYYKLILGKKTGAELTQAFQTIPTGVTSLDLSGYDNSLSKYNEIYSFANAIGALPESVISINFSKALFHLKVDQLVTILSNLPPRVTSLNLSYCFNEHSPEDLKKIFAILRNKNVTSLDLSKNDVLTSEAIKALPDTVTSLNLSSSVLFRPLQLLNIFKDLPRNMTHLNLSDNNVAFFLNKSLLVNGFKDLPPNLAFIDLSNNFFTHVPETLTDVIKALPQSVTSIGFSQKEINATSGDILVKFLTAIPANIKSIIIDGTSMAIDEFQNKQTAQLKTRVLTNLEAGLLNIKQKEGELHNRKCETASLAANKLYGALSELKKKYEGDTIDYLDFKSQSTAAISEAHKELDLHRGWKEILGNLALCVLGCGIFYLAACLYKGTFFKFNTDSANKLDVLQKTIDADGVSTPNI